LSYESFAINGWPIIHTVSQAMAELRRKTPSVVSCLPPVRWSRGVTAGLITPGDRKLFRRHDAQR